MNDIKDYLEDRNILEFYTKGFAKNGYRSTDLLNDVNNNGNNSGLY